MSCKLWVFLLFCWSLSLLSVRQLQGQSQVIDSLNTALQTAQTDSARVSLRNQLVFQYRKVQALNIALEFAHEVLPMAEALGNKRLLNEALENLAIIYAEQGNFTQALRYRERIYRLVQSLNNPKNEVYALSMIAQEYIRLGDMAKAESQLNSALALARKINDPEKITLVLTRQAFLHFQTFNLPKAEEKLLESIAILRKMNDKTQLANNLINLALCYQNMGQFPKALQKAKEGLRLQRELKEPIGVGMALAHVGNIYADMKRYQTARDCLLVAYEMSKRYQDASLAQNAPMFLMRVDTLMGNHKDAVSRLEHLLNVKDSMAVAQRQAELKRLEDQFKVERELDERKQQEIIAQQERIKTYYLFSAIGGIILISTGFLYFRYRSKVRNNKVLQSQRDQIMYQKAELESAYHELNATLDQIQAQKTEIEAKQLKIEDSIRYAYQIQKAILPQLDLHRDHLGPYTIYYRPKDIVSGDFYWFSAQERYYFICVGDCTGHGVPGAFMSVLGSNSLHVAVNEMNIVEPAAIMHEVDRMIRRSLQQDGFSVTLDGMDAALVVIDRQEMKLHFSGAGRPLYHMRGKELNDIRGVKYPLGGRQHLVKTFVSHTIDILPGDRIFLYSDGITDQFGGNLGRKFTSIQLQAFLLSHYDVSMQELGLRFEEVMQEWMRFQAQLDDQTFIGFEIMAEPNPA
jgi:serine phosphatase RsbU (regulator of sigma subunit)